MWDIERTNVVKTVFQGKVRFELTCVGIGGGMVESGVLN